VLVFERYMPYRDEFGLRSAIDVSNSWSFQLSTILAPAVQISTFNIGRFRHRRQRFGPVGKTDFVAAGFLATDAARHENMT
jgi:hypothetical protein